MNFLSLLLREGDRKRDFEILFDRERVRLRVGERLRLRVRLGVRVGERLRVGGGDLERGDVVGVFKAV